MSWFCFVIGLLILCAIGMGYHNGIEDARNHEFGLIDALLS